MNELRYLPAETPAERKRRLIAQGALFRANSVQCKEALREGLRPQALVQGALGQALSAASGAIVSRDGQGGAPRIDFEKVLPLALTGISALSKRKKLVKPALGTALALGAVGALTAYMGKRKSARGGTRDTQ